MGDGILSQTPCNLTVFVLWRRAPIPRHASSARAHPPSSDGARLKTRSLPHRSANSWPRASEMDGFLPNRACPRLSLCLRTVRSPLSCVFLATAAPMTHLKDALGTRGLACRARSSSLCSDQLEYGGQSHFSRHDGSSQSGRRESPSTSGRF
ncbi:hypothetical protein BT67DRAFT_158245 [Trichocladium antarcticum]|uniref:Uncharacterized protein n=1 Tax=Trichocladium antarcticum TaxID=1450529 RepID=A0AAN6UE81_9PEZI|nr:hypothetical protein BT67DRAFT_158245 [Trichocladium antarcticum]